MKLLRFRLQSLGLALVSILVVACGSVPVVQTPKSPSEIPQTADQDDTANDIEGSYDNTLKWSTASEIDNFGFDIFRADNEDGPFVRLNDSPIPGAGTSDVPTYYEYVDDTIDPHRGYYYYIESISINGERERFTPTNYAAPKIDPSGSEDPS